MDQQIKTQILNIFNEIQDNDGIAPLTKISVRLKEHGIEYKALGYYKLSELFKDIPELDVFWETPEKDKPPIAYIRKRIARFYDFTYVNDEQYEELSQMALDEKWYFGKTKPIDMPYPILRNYLSYTFIRLYKNNQIKYATDSEDRKQYASFNTGLVDKKYEYIYALFSKSPYKERQPWLLEGFFVRAEKWGGKKIVKLFNPLPEKADYFEGDISNMLFDPSKGDLNISYEHIICDNISRFPKEFIEDAIPKTFNTTIDDTTLDDAFNTDDNDLKEQYFNKLGKKIESDNRTLNNMINRLKAAVDFAKKRVDWNYKSAIPIYYPRNDKGSLLLPLSLIYDDKVDLALVVEKHDNNSYTAPTVLTLEMAYTDSRVVTRPDSDWLNTERINATSTIGEYDE